MDDTVGVVEQKRRFIEAVDHRRDAIITIAEGGSSSHYDDLVLACNEPCVCFCYDPYAGGAPKCLRSCRFTSSTFTKFSPTNPYRGAVVSACSICSISVRTCPGSRLVSFAHADDTRSSWYSAFCIVMLGSRPEPEVVTMSPGTS